MKAVILCGGRGTRLREETEFRPKPLVEIGGKPMLWHIMKIYSQYGIKDFILCLGYKGDMIKDFFINFKFNSSDSEIDFKKNEIKYLNESNDEWKIKLINTGKKTNTAGRIRRVKKYLANEKFFCLTYADGLTNSDINKSIKHHIKNKKMLTVTAVKQPGRFGSLQINKNNIVKSFSEKVNDNYYINGGFFVLSNNILNRIKRDSDIFEKDILPKLVKENNVSAFKHDGFWQCMDNIREKDLLNNLWKKNKAAWKVWL